MRDSRTPRDGHDDLVDVVGENMERELVPFRVGGAASAEELVKQVFEQFRHAKTILDAHTDAWADEIEQAGTVSKRPREFAVGQ